jgi:hypothetical protein
MQFVVNAAARRTARQACGDRGAVGPGDVRVLRLRQEGLVLCFAAAGLGLDALGRRLSRRAVDRRPGGESRPWGRADGAARRRGAGRRGREGPRGRAESVRVAFRVVGRRADRERRPAGGGRRGSLKRSGLLGRGRRGGRRGRRRWLEGDSLQERTKTVAEPAAADPPPGEGRKEAEPGPSSPSRRAAMAGPRSAQGPAGEGPAVLMKPVRARPTLSSCNGL